MLVHTLDGTDWRSFVISDDPHRRTVHRAADSHQTILPCGKDHVTYGGEHRGLLYYTDTISCPNGSNSSTKTRE